MSTPRNPPTVDELRQHAIVLQALEDAWLDSFPDDPARRHEEGGWIYIDLKMGQLSVRRAPSGLQAELELGDPPPVPDCVVVGIFHTHPNPTDEGWDPGPSDVDEVVHDHLGLPGLIRADNGVYTTGPVRRRGGLGGGAGYPA